MSHVTEFHTSSVAMECKIALRVDLLDVDSATWDSLEQFLFQCDPAAERRKGLTDPGASI